MRKLFTILVALLVAATAVAQSSNTIVIEKQSFRAVQTDALTGVNIDPVGLDSSRRPCARIKMKISRMTKEEIDQLELKIITNNELRKCKTADYDNGLIIEMTAKPESRFYLHHPKYGDSDEVTLSLEANREYYIEAHLNQTFSIVVNSNVSGASVYLDGEYKGQTDSSNSCTVKDVLIGPHKLKVSYGTLNYEQDIEVNGDNISFRQSVNSAVTKPQFVVFSVEPSSAVVTIDNKHYPLQEGMMQVVLANGTYNYTVSAAGYHSQSGTFTVAGAKVEKLVSLKADSATVTLTAPDGAEIWVNGVKKGISRWSGALNAGTYIFEARKEGYTPSSMSQEITSDNQQRSYSLPAPTPIVGALVVTSTPLMADVEIDGKPVGRTPLELLDILVGTHLVKVSKSGYNAESKMVTVADGTSAEINISLVKSSLSSSDVVAAQPGSYKIGDIVTVNGVQGVVFQTAPTVKLISVDEIKDKWSTVDVSTWARDPYNGATNMRRVKAMADWQSKYPIFKWCADLGAGWYIPAIEEVKAIYKQKAAINNILTAKGFVALSDSYHWSSTEQNSYDAHAISFSSGGNKYGEDDKDFYKFSTRAVFEFKPAEQAPVNSQYSIGDIVTIKGVQGIVFQTYPKVKIVSVAESKAWWGPKGVAVGATDTEDGAKNMEKIKSVSGWKSKFPAFKWCTELGDGWYLPAGGELIDIYHQKELLNQKLSAAGLPLIAAHNWAYWTSTEYNEDFNEQYNSRNCTFTIILSSGRGGHAQKCETKPNASGGFYVRAVITLP